MQNKKIIWAFIISIIGFCFGLILKNSISFGICLLTEPTCINTMSRLGDSLFYGMGALAIIFFFLIFTPQAVTKWQKFAIWYVPLATLLFIFYPDPSSGDLLSPYPEQVFQYVSATYLAVSTLIIFFNLHRT
jgi:hypothetical protein